MLHLLLQGQWKWVGRGRWGQRPLQFLKNAKNVPSRILKIPTCYIYLVNPLEEEFHGLYKTYKIKSGLNYNKDLEGK